MEEQRVKAGAGPIPSAHLGFVDAAKGLGILAVIWGHMDYLWSTSSVWFSSFKLAVFFVVVGLLKAHRYEDRGQEESCGAVWGKRLYSLVIPYGVYSLLAILVHLAFAAVRHQGMLEALQGDVLLTVTLRGIATLWFLPTLLLAELLFAAIRPESRSRAVKLLLCILVPVLLRYLEGRVSLRPLIWCGKNSMFLMATHLPWYIAPVLMAVGKRFYTAAAPDVKYFLVMLAEFAALMAIEFVMVWCKDKIKGTITGGGKEKAVSRAIQYL